MHEKATTYSLNASNTEADHVLQVLLECPIKRVTQARLSLFFYVSFLNWFYAFLFVAEIFQHRKCDTID